MEVIKKSDQTDQAKLWKFIYGFADSLVLKCAVELEIADTIHKHGEPMTLSELASQLPKQPIDTDRLYRIMRYLVQIKLFSKETTSQSGEIKYGLLPPAKYVVRGWHNSMVAALLLINDKDFIASWHYLKDGLGGECDAFEKANGKKIWDYMSENPEKNKLFNEGMACDTRLVTWALVQDCTDVFKGIKTLVDVGGGTGTAVKAISDAFPDIKCAVYDLPHVIADSPVAPNIDRIEGDMFKSIPNADAIFMKCILHDWNDDECIQILKQCKKALPRDGGKVIIVDVVLNVDSKHPYTKMRLTLDLDMMLNTGGKERTEEEWKELFEAAGFSGYKIIQTSALQSEKHKSGLLNNMTIENYTIASLLTKFLEEDMDHFRFGSAILRLIWKARNYRVFKGTNMAVNRILHSTQIFYNEHKNPVTATHEIPSAAQVDHTKASEDHWTLPPMGWVKLDGSYSSGRIAA